MGGSNAKEKPKDKEKKDLAKTLRLIQTTLDGGATRLDLNNRHIRELPDTLEGKKDVLKWLSMSHNVLKGLPLAVCQFVSLVALRVNANQLSSLPDAITTLTALQVLDLSKNKFIEWDAAILAMSQLTDLNLQCNQISSLPDDFGSLSALRYLNLYLNKISKFDIDWKVLGSLTNLDLSFNDLKDTSLSETFDLPSLTFLPLSGNKLTTIPRPILQLSALKNLDLRFNKIDRLPEDLGAMATTLRCLKLCNNQLPVTPVCISQLVALEELDLSSNLLVALDNIETLTKLTSLQAYWNKIEYLPEAFGKLTDLKELYLTDNAIKGLPASLGQLKELRTLMINYNKISMILPDTCEHLKSVNVLNIAYNDLIALPEEINKLESLTRLDARSNILTTLPPSLKDLPKLQVLDVGDNGLLMVPPVIFEMTSLNLLNLFSNGIAVIPPSIALLTSLTSLNLSFNQLSVLPKELGTLLHLVHLRLDGNFFTEFPECIVNLVNLKDLAVGSNRQIRELPATISQLTNLVSLQASSNQLQLLPATFPLLKNLTELDLSHNRLMTLPYDLDKLTALTDLDISGNALTRIPMCFGNMHALQQVKISFNPGLADVPSEYLRSPTTWISCTGNPKIEGEYYFASKKAGEKSGRWAPSAEEDIQPVELSLPPTPEPFGNLSRPSSPLPSQPNFNIAMNTVSDGGVNSGSPQKLKDSGGHNSSSSTAHHSSTSTGHNSSISTGHHNSTGASSLGSPSGLGPSSGAYSPIAGTFSVLSGASSMGDHTDSPIGNSSVQHYTDSIVGTPTSSNPLASSATLISNIPTNASGSLTSSNPNLVVASPQKSRVKDEKSKDKKKQQMNSDSFHTPSALDERRLTLLTREPSTGDGEQTLTASPSASPSTVSPLASSSATTTTTTPKDDTPPAPLVSGASSPSIKVSSDRGVDKKREPMDKKREKEEKKDRKAREMVAQLAMNGEIRISRTPQVGWAEMRGARPDMQDSAVVMENFQHIPELTLLGLFDGHGGADTALLVAKKLPILLSESIRAVLEARGLEFNLNSILALSINDHGIIMRSTFMALHGAVVRAGFTDGAAATVALICHKYGDTPKAETPAQNQWSTINLNVIRGDEDYRDTTPAMWCEKAKAAQMLLAGPILPHNATPSTSANASSSRTTHNNGGVSSSGEILAQTAPITLPIDAPKSLKKGRAKTVGSASSAPAPRKSLLILGNCGDQRAVLCRKGKAFALTEDHKPEKSSELARIALSGGFVAESRRVNGLLALSRAIGDVSVQPHVTFEPDVMVVEFTEHDEFVIIACDGVWDVLSSEQAVFLALAESSPSRAANRIREYAFSLGSTDNISVVIYQLKPRERTNFGTNLMTHISESLQSTSPRYGSSPSLSSSLNNFGSLKCHLH